MTTFNEKIPPRTVAILSYVTIVGWIVALVMNSKNRSELGSFHIRQALGLYLWMFIARFVMIVPFVGWLAGASALFLGFVLWRVGLISAVQEEEKPVPIVGDYFQEWFKTL